MKQNWKRALGQRLRHMSTLQARRFIDRISAHGITIEQPAVRELTGGFAGQTINAYVLRKLAVKAGMIRQPDTEQVD